MKLKDLIKLKSPKMLKLYGEYLIAQKRQEELLKELEMPQQFYYFSVADLNREPKNLKLKKQFKARQKIYHDAIIRLSENTDKLASIELIVHDEIKKRNRNRNKIGG